MAEIQVIASKKQDHESWLDYLHLFAEGTTSTCACVRVRMIVAGASKRFLFVSDRSLSHFPICSHSCALSRERALSCSLAFPLTSSLSLFISLSISLFFSLFLSLLYAFASTHSLLCNHAHTCAHTHARRHTHYLSLFHTRSQGTRNTRKHTYTPKLSLFLFSSLSRTHITHTQHTPQNPLA